MTVVAWVAVWGIGGLDAWDLPAVRLGAVYVLPVLAASAWGIGHAGLLTAVTSVGVDAAASVVHGLADPRILVPMGLLRLGVYLACWALVRVLQRDRERLRDLATTDYATEVYNLRGLTDLAGPLIERCSRNGEPVSVLFLDINAFKSINDRYGHATGDTVLQTIGQQLRLAVRGHDLVARVGGDEFAVLLTDTDERGAEAVAANVSSSLFDLVPPSPLPDGFRLSLSIGHITGRDNIPTLSHLLTLADQAMYRAKEHQAHQPRPIPPPIPAAPGYGPEPRGQ